MAQGPRDVESSWANWAVPHCPLSSVILQEKGSATSSGEHGGGGDPQAVTFNGREALFLTHEIYIYIIHIL